MLGIFGSQGLDLATLWGRPPTTDPGAFAFRMYRNYDGAQHGFGDVSTQAASADQGTLAVYAAQRSADNALTVMVINKVANPLTSTVTLAGYAPASKAAVYQYSSANVTAIAHPANQAVSATGFSATFPGNSITLFVMTPGMAATPTSTSVASSLNPSTFGASVQFTATVTSSGGTPTGAVTFKDGSTTLVWDAEQRQGDVHHLDIVGRKPLDHRRLWRRHELQRQRFTGADANRQV